MIDAVDEPLRAAHWPQRGLVKFEGVQMRYRPELPAVLRSVDFTLEPGVKGAVVGRSGAGKSSLSVALLRLSTTCPCCRWSSSTAPTASARAGERTSDAAAAPPC